MNFWAYVQMISQCHHWLITRIYWNNCIKKWHIPFVMTLNLGIFERLILSFVLQVTQQHAGQYSCQPFNQRGSAAPSPIIQVIIKDPPTLLSRPNNEYIKNVGGKVSFACQAAGTPTPDIRWRRVRNSIFNKVYFKYP